MDRFTKARAAFVSVTQNFSTADTMGRLTLNVLMSFAECEREMIAERTRDKITASRKRGKWTGGRIPLGFVVREGKLTIDEHEALTVRGIFATYLEHRSIVRIIATLKERGWATKLYESREGKIRPRRAWTKDAVLGADRAELAGVLGFTRARVTQLMDLTLLAPDIQEEILIAEVEPGRDVVTERARAVVRTGDWGAQRERWPSLGLRCFARSGPPEGGTALVRL
jgi:hypothetical protein